MAEYTVEALQNEILELQEQVHNLTSERDALSENNKTLSTSLEEARTLNQKMFLELRATSQSADGKTNNEDQETESCADFAKKLSI